VKVHTADRSVGDIADLRLKGFDSTISEAEYINIPKDHFEQEGPNGIHQCLVFTVLGTRVSPELWMGNGRS